MYLNEATLLNNVRRRYKNDLIYVRNPLTPFIISLVISSDLRGEYFDRNQSV